MKILAAVITIVLSSLAFADHYTGTYQSAQGMTVNIQHSQNGQMQGSLSGAGMPQMSFQGQGNQDGAYGSMMSPQGVMGFQAQLSPDGQVLQMALYRMNQQGQPDQSSVQQFSANRVAGGGMQQFPPANTGGQQFPPANTGGQQFPPANTGGQQFPPANTGGQQFPPVNTGGQQFPPVNTGDQQFPPANTGGIDSNIPATNAQADWSGSYSDGQITLNLQGANGTYQGVIVAGGQQMMVQGQGNASYLELQIQTGNGMMQAYLEQFQGQVYLVTETNEFVLQKANGMSGTMGTMPANPLGN